MQSNESILHLLMSRKAAWSSFEDELDDLKLDPLQALTLPWYLKLFAKNWPISIQLLLGAGLVQVFALALPIFNMVIFDRVFGRNNLAALDIIGLGIVVVIVFDLVVKMFRTYLLAHQLRWIDDISSRLWIQQLLNAGKNHTGKAALALVDRYGELLKVNRVVARHVFVTALDCVFSVGVIILLLLISPTLTMIAMLPLLPIAITGLCYTPAVRRQQNEFARDLKKSQLSIVEVLKHYDDLLSNNAQYVKVQALHLNIQTFVSRHFGYTLSQVGQGNIEGFFINLGSILTLYVGAKIVLAGDLSFGSYLAVNTLSRGVSTSFQKAVSGWMEYQEASSSTAPIRQLLQNSSVSDRKRDFLPVSQEFNGQLTLDKVSFRFENELGQSGPWVLNNVSLTIEPGEKVLITGKSGAGKTSLCELLQRLKDPTKGFVRLDGLPAADIDPDLWRSMVGYCPHKPAMFEGTLYDNIVLGLTEIPMQDVLSIVEITHLQDLIEQSEKGFDTAVMPMGMNLSRSHAQRIGLARMLLRQPKVMVLDEAMSELPPAVRLDILRNIQKTWPEMGSVIVSNFIPMHQLSDRILVMEEGQFVESGTFQNLRSKPGAYLNLFQIGEPAS